MNAVLKTEAVAIEAASPLEVADPAKNLMALWGRLSADVLLQDFSAAMDDLLRLKELVELDAAAPPEEAAADPSGTQVWYDLADCESGGNWSIDSGNGYYGGLQFSLGTWESVGGTGYPHEHPAATQIEMGRRLQARQGWGAWPHCAEQLGLS